MGTSFLGDDHGMLVWASDRLFLVTIATFLQKILTVLYTCIYKIYTHTKLTHEALLSLRRPIVLRMTYGIAAEPNRRKFRVCNSHDHVTTLPMAIPDAEISAVRFSPCVVAERYIVGAYSKIVWRSE